jgi:hypothetical protein
MKQMKAGPWSACLLAAGLAFSALSCGRSGFGPAPPTVIRIEVTLNSGTIGQQLLVFTWAGDWQTDTGSQSGATTDGRQFGVPAGLQNNPITLPDSQDLRPGTWQISLSVAGGNNPLPPIINTVCTVRISPYTVNVIQFTQGLPGCSAPSGLVL